MQARRALLRAHHQHLQHQHQHILAYRCGIVMSRNDNKTEAPSRRKSQQPVSRSVFDVPAPIKQLFDRFPLVTYDINHLPQRAPQHRNAPVLHVFATEAEASKGAPSYNPACLKWQVGSIAHSMPNMAYAAPGIPQIFRH